jgi:hypothetical protein
MVRTDYPSPRPRGPRTTTGGGLRTLGGVGPSAGAAIFYSKEQGQSTVRKTTIAARKKCRPDTLCEDYPESLEATFAAASEANCSYAAAISSSVFSVIGSAD